MSHYAVVEFALFLLRPNQIIANYVTKNTKKGNLKRKDQKKEHIQNNAVLNKKKCS